METDWFIDVELKSFNEIQSFLEVLLHHNADVVGYDIPKPPVIMAKGLRLAVTPPPYVRIYLGDEQSFLIAQLVR